MKTIKWSLLNLVMMFGCLATAFGQLQWNSYSDVGVLVSNNVASGGDATYGGSITFTIPASTERVFMTETFVPTNLAASGASAKINFTFSVTGGLNPGNTGRVLGMGLLNDPGTPNNGLDDAGYWTDLNTGNSPGSFELFYRSNGITTFFQYDSARKLGSGKVSVGYPSNNVPYGMQFQLNNIGGNSIGIGTSSAYANAGAVITNFNGGVGIQAYASATLLTTLSTTTFNEFAFMYNNLSASPVTVTLSGITLVPANPIIQTQPLGYSGSPGDTTPGTDFSVVLNASSGTPLGFQWYQATATATNELSDGTTASGTIISGSLTANLGFANAQPGDSAGYFVVVTNAYGSVTSSPALLNIAASSVAPTITAITPSAATVIAGQGTNITISALGAPSPVYYWSDNNNNLIQSGASATLILANVQPANAGTYSVVASNYLGTAATNFTISVIVTPTISSQPTNLLLNVGDPANFSVTASGTPSPTYQWYMNNNPISGATATNYSIASVGLADIGTYSVVVSNSAGATTSTGAYLAEYSTMNGTPTAPANNATGVCVDTLLSLTFDQAPTVGNTGQINIYNTANPSTPVDTLDLSGGNLQMRTIGGVSLKSYDVLTSGNTATIYPHAGVLAPGQTYFVTIDPGVIVDPNGAYFTGISGSAGWQFTTKSSGPANATNLMVAADGSGDFCTVQGAIDFVPAANTTPTVINIKNGLYTEINRVNSKNNITFIGQNRGQTVIAYANNNNINGSSTTRPMFGVVSANDIAIENLTLTNSTPHGGSQAEALLVNLAKRFIVLNATLCSYQDTLLVNQSGDQAYIQDSHIQGDTDYIWGSGTLYATNDELMAMSVQSYLTQARTAQNTNGFAFVNCRIYGANSAITNGALGRDAGASGNTPNYPYGQVAYISCTMDTNLIIPAGWVLGSGSSQGPDTANLRFWEYQSVDLNGNPVNTSARVPWSIQLDGNTATNLVENVSNWLYGWQPQLAPNILANPVSLFVSGGASATFSVAATGIGAPTYQWLQNGNPLAGQTNNTLTIGQAYAGQAGTYSVIVSNAAGSVTSSPATLTVGGTAPVFTPVGDQTLSVGFILNVTNIVTDPDVPPKTLSFALLSGPAGSSVDPGTGIFTWRATAASAGTTIPVSIVVSDDGSPSLSATQTFNVIINPVSQPTTTQLAYTQGQFTFVINGDPGPDYIVQSSTNLIEWQSVVTNVSPTLPFAFTDLNPNNLPIQFYRVLLGP
jgi:hypothetical protein